MKIFKENGHNSQGTSMNSLQRFSTRPLSSCRASKKEHWGEDRFCCWLLGGPKTAKICRLVTHGEEVGGTHPPLCNYFWSFCRDHNSRELLNLNPNAGHSFFGTRVNSMVSIPLELAASHIGFNRRQFMLIYFWTTRLPAENRTSPLCCLLDAVRDHVGFARNRWSLVKFTDLLSFRTNISFANIVFSKQDNKPSSRLPLLWLFRSVWSPATPFLPF